MCEFTLSNYFTNTILQKNIYIYNAAIDAGEVGYTDDTCC